MTISSKIRKQLEQPNGLTKESLEPLAAEYSRIVADANRRLEACVGFLRRGLRSEALQRAMIKPRVLDLAADLDFPEHSEWIEILQFYGIDPPENLDREAIAHLHEAFAEEQPLEELLRQHRRLALAKAPLAWRLTILRKIAKIDSMNPVWMEDIREWETARIKQISAERSMLNDSQVPLEELERLSDEVHSSKWTVKPPSDLVAEIDRVTRQRVYEAKVSEMRQLANDLLDAYSAGDERTVSSLASAWSLIVKGLQQPPPLDLLEEVAPALEWIQKTNSDREQHQQLRALSTALDTMLLQPTVSERELQRAYDDAAALQLGIDPALENRFATRMRDLQQAKRRRQMLYLSCIVGSTLVVMIAGGLWYWNRNFQLAVADTSTKLTRLIEQEQYHDALSIYASIQSRSPSVAKAPEVAALKTNLDSKVAAEKNRRDEVSKLIDAADSDQAESLKIERIAAAEKAAKTAEEKSRVASIRSRFEKFQQGMADEELKRVRMELQRIEADLDRIQKAPLKSVEEKELDLIIADLNGLFNRYPRAIDAGGKIVDQATEKAWSLRDSVRRYRRELSQKQSLLARIRGATSLGDFETQLRKFIEAMPAEPFSLEFEESLKEKELWKTVQKWNEWCADSNLQLAGKLDVAKTETMLTRYEQLTQSIVGLPEADAVALYKKKYEPLPKREELLVGLVENLDDSVIVECVAVVSSIGKRSFIHHEAVAEVVEIFNKTNSFSLTTIPVISDANGGLSNRDFKGKIEISGEPRQFIRTLIRNLKNSKDAIIANWETEWVKLMDPIISTPNVDSQIKELLLARLSSTAQDGSSTMMKAFVNLQNELFKTSDARGRWYVESTVNNQLREELASEYENAKRQLQRILGEESETLKELSQARLDWAGTLLRDSNGGIAPSLAREDIPDGTLLVVCKDPADPSRGRLVQVGYVRNRVGVLQGDPYEVAPGRPLFWIRTIPKKQ